jgi:hypothetical protein
MFTNKYFDPLYFFISFAIGIFFNYMVRPMPHIIIKYPTPYNNNLKYDVNANLFKGTLDLWKKKQFDLDSILNHIYCFINANTGGSGICEIIRAFSNTPADQIEEYAKHILPSIYTHMDGSDLSKVITALKHTPLSLCKIIIDRSIVFKDKNIYPSLSLKNN